MIFDQWVVVTQVFPHPLANPAAGTKRPFPVGPKATGGESAGPHLGLPDEIMVAHSALLPPDHPMTRLTLDVLPTVGPVHPWGPKDAHPLPSRSTP